MKTGRITLLCHYLFDRAGVLLLCFFSILTVVALSFLYRIENLPPMLHASFIIMFIWCCAGGYDLFLYWRAFRKLEALTLYSGEELWLPCPRGRIEGLYQEILTAERKHYTDYLTKAGLERTGMNDYYAMWAHQIKTPIAAMKLLLEEDSGENWQSNQYAVLEELFKTEQYVEMALNYLRIESISSDMLLREYNLLDMVKQVIKKYSILFINRKLKLELEEFECSVVTDEKWLFFVLEQVLSNAVKYTRNGTISIYIDRSRGKTLVIEDTGIGIRAEDLPRVFDRGFTGYNGRMDKKSSGIGLYLCRSVMIRLGSDISIESSPQKGTRAVLNLNREVWEHEKIS